jgi:hypothetical protein
MKHNYTFASTLTLLLLFVCTCVRAQTPLAVQSFESAATDTWGFTTDPVAYISGEDVWSDTTALAGITPSEGARFWGMSDLENGNGGQAGDNLITFSDFTVTGETDILVSFDYQVIGWDVGDDLFHQIVINGTPGTRVKFVDGDNAFTTNGWETITLVVPDGTTTVGLIIAADQNGGDFGGLDNFTITSDNIGGPCGITGFGPGATEVCLSSSNDVGSPDAYALSIAYSGIDADAVLAVSVGGSAVASFDISTGNDPTTDANGTLNITSPNFLEGTSYEVVLTDGGGNCNFTVSGSVATDACVSVCDLTATFPDDVTITCTDFTSADNADGIMVEIDYTGFEPGITVTAPGLTIGGDDPAVDADGTIVITGLVEGGNYVISISGGDCTGGDAINFPVPVPSNFCTPTAVVINEVLADPGTVNDANNDGVANGSTDEFIEIFNTSEDDIDVSGWTISEGAGVRYTFAPGYILPGRNAFVLFGGGVPNVPCLNDVASTSFIGLNNGGDIVIVKNALGFTVAQMSYGSEGNNDQSLALNPDGDISGGYVQHTTIPNPSGAPLTNSACLENDDPQFALPINLLTFSATVADKHITLDWATDNEIANDRFVVERSAVGRQWRQIGTVMATGEAVGSYGFMDDQPLEGQNLYRLRQIDLDGSYAVYGPVVASFTHSAQGLFPNPAGGVLNFTKPLQEGSQVVLMDSNGRQLRRISDVGNQLVIADLKPGIYVIRVENGDLIETLRFVKQ